MPYHPSGDVMQACINDSNATWRVRHFSRHECSSYRYPAVDTASGRRWCTAGASYGECPHQMQQNGVCKAQQPNYGYPTLASSLMQARVEKLSKHRQSNTDFCRCRCLPSSGCPKIVWATSCCGLTATKAHDLHRQGDRTQLVVNLYTSCSWLSNKTAEIKTFWPLLFAMSCGRVTVNLIGQVVGHRECWRQCSAVGKWGANARGLR